LGKKRFHLTRQLKFFSGLGILVFIFTFAFYASIANLPRTWLLLLSTSVVFIFAVWILFKLTIKKIKLNYPLTSPSGKPDVYTGNEIPRPIYEDMQRYPWFFNKKRLNKKIKNKQRKERQ